jgi:chromosome partitioning protein
MLETGEAEHDLCRLPMRPSALDGDAAGAALKMIRDAGRAARRTGPAPISIIQTDAATVTKPHKELRAKLGGAGVERVQTELMRRASFGRVMARGKTLFEPGHTQSVARVISTTARLGKELAEILKVQ